MNDQERLFAQKVAYFEYVIPFPFFDEKAVRKFYQTWADDRGLAVDMHVRPSADPNPLMRVVSRDLELRFDVSNKTPDEAYEIHTAMRSLDYIDELEKENK